MSACCRSADSAWWGSGLVLGRPRLLAERFNPPTHSLASDNFDLLKYKRYSVEITQHCLIIFICDKKQNSMKYAGKMQLVSENDGDMHVIIYTGLV